MAALIYVKTPTRQPIGNCAKMLWLHSFYGDSLSGNCTCHQKCTSLNPVWDHPVFCAVKLRHAFDDEPARSSALDLGAHLIQEVCQVHNLGLLCCSFNYCHTVGQNGSHHHVIGAEHGRAEFTLHVDNRSAEFRCKNLDIAPPHAHRCAERFKTFKVQINWPIADDTTTGQRDCRFLATAERGSKHTNRSAHLSDDVVGANRMDLFCRDTDGPAGAFHLRAQVS